MHASLPDAHPYSVGLPPPRPPGWGPPSRPPDRAGSGPKAQIFRSKRSHGASPGPPGMRGRVPGPQNLLEALQEATEVQASVLEICSQGSGRSRKSSMLMRSKRAGSASQPAKKGGVRSPTPFWAGLEADPARLNPTNLMISGSGRGPGCKSPEPWLEPPVALKRYRDRENGPCKHM
jgi:hypothetical protein